MPASTPRKPVPTTIDDYIAIQPAPAKAALTQVRKALKKALPKATEVIAYNMPGFKSADGAVLSFAAWKNHYSIYGATAAIVKAFADELKPYKIQKGTISFPYSEPVPIKLIESIANFRAKELNKEST